MSGQFQKEFPITEKGVVQGTSEGREGQRGAMGLLAHGGSGHAGTEDCMLTSRRLRKQTEKRQELRLAHPSVAHFLQQSPTS